MEDIKVTTKIQEEALLDQIIRRQESGRRMTSRMLKPARDLTEKPWAGIDPEIVERRHLEEEARKASVDAENRERRIREAWSSSGVGARFRYSRLDSYETPTDGHCVALAACRQAVEGFGAGDGLLLLGDPGGGKTHLLCGMLFEAAQLGMSIRYVTAEDFYIGLRSRMDEPGGLSENGLLDKFARPDVLALDDLYCVAAAKSAHEESYQYRMLWALLDRRYRECRATIEFHNNNNWQRYVDAKDATIASFHWNIVKGAPKKK